jgi:hypothetical protein
MKITQNIDHQLGTVSDGRRTLCGEKTKDPSFLKGLGVPEGSRTPNLLIRSQVLYPIELREHFP